MSVGLTAKGLSVQSMRDQADQVTEGRFDCQKFEFGGNTDNMLLDQYMKKDVKNMGIETDSV